MSSARQFPRVGGEVKKFLVVAEATGPDPFEYRAATGFVEEAERPIELGVPAAFVREGGESAPVEAAVDADAPENSVAFADQTILGGGPGAIRGTGRVAEIGIDHIREVGEFVVEKAHEGGFGDEPVGSECEHATALTGRVAIEFGAFVVTAAGLPEDHGLEGGAEQGEVGQSAVEAGAQAPVGEPIQVEAGEGLDPSVGVGDAVTTLAFLVERAQLGGGDRGQASGGAEPNRGLDQFVFEQGLHASGAVDSGVGC